MNHQMMKNYAKQDPNFYNHCHWVNPKDVEFDLHQSQVRKNGHVVSRVASLAEAIRTSKQKVPVSVRRLPSGKWDLKDGCTRTLAVLQLARENPSQKLWVCDYQDAVLRFNDDDWFTAQAKANDHPITTPNSDADRAHWITRWVQNGIAERHLGYKYFGNELKFLEDATARAVEIHKNSGKTTRWFKNRIADAVQASQSFAFENYTKPSGLAKFCKWIGHVGTQIGEVVNNEVVYVLNNDSHYSPNIIGNVGTKRRKNPNIKVILVYWVGDLAGKNEQDIRDMRDNIIALVKEDNKYYSPMAPSKWIDELWFMPQIKGGNNPDNFNQAFKATL
tara:strand:+ start:597 stop:1595 length:999 start_codon:yes stop_codon:yes gene_type:complete